MRTLFHADDDLSWREILAEQIEGLPLDLKQFGTREEALAAIEKIKPGDIVVTDLHLREGKPVDQTGYEIARRARELGVRDVTIASSTGSPSQQIDGVTIQEKGTVARWIRGLVRG